MRREIPVNPADFFGTISSIYEGAEMADNTINEIINKIQNDEKIPENLKPYVISSIQKDTNIGENTKNLLIDLIQTNEKIPENLKSLVINAVSENTDITGLNKR